MQRCKPQADTANIGHLAPMKMYTFILHFIRKCSNYSYYFFGIVFLSFFLKKTMFVENEDLSLQTTVDKTSLSLHISKWLKA